MSSHTEEIVLLLLSDSNLPTGGFHFSSGLESSTKHGLVPSTCTPSQTRPSALEPFLLHSLRAHARSTLSFVAGAHTIASIPPPSPLDPTRQRFSPGSSTASWKADQLGLLDAAYEAFTSNHITRRGSKTQGAGMLSLWSKSLKKPAYLVQKGTEEDEASELMEELRRRIRAGTLEGHLPVCWGVLCGVLGLSKERTLHLHLFLHARAILSSSVRLNQIGPYNAQSLLLHTAPPIIDAELQVYAQAPYEGDVTISTRQPLTAEEEEMEEDYEGNKGGPRAVWPLGEILQGRHDFMHSRLFNT